MNKVLPLLTISLILSCHQTTGQIEKVGPIAGFLRTNAVGHPVIHEKKQWIFDPDVARKRSKTFIQLHGDKGEKLIERLGLGIDGKEDERLVIQRARDEGHLGGLNFYLP